jgi:hypothetical protein
VIFLESCLISQHTTGIRILDTIGLLQRAIAIAGESPMVQTPIEPQRLYPDSDGKPMADNTVQYRCIVRLVANLKHLFKGQLVFVAGDLLWYPQQVTVPPAPAQAPDVMALAKLQELGIDPTQL